MSSLYCKRFLAFSKQIKLLLRDERLFTALHLLFDRNFSPSAVFSCKNPAPVAFYSPPNKGIFIMTSRKHNSLLRSGGITAVDRLRTSFPYSWQ